MSAPDYLSPILARTRVEVRRRRRRWARWNTPSSSEPSSSEPSSSEPSSSEPSSSERLPWESTLARLRRDGPLHVIAEVKFRSPSAGTIHPRIPGAVAAIAAGYEAAGAAAVSVLADRMGFGGSPLDVRRASSAVDVPVLFKGFVLDEVQVDLARAMGARLVLLLVRALEPLRLRELVNYVEAQGLLPLVEAASAAELEAAVETGAAAIGVNARDLSTFRVDLPGGLALIENAPADRCRVIMSGVRSKETLDAVAERSVDAVLIGEGLMRAPSPPDRLREWMQ
ncbi:MAG: indole-3-glycerol-phosphate synthase TrpC [Myxococcota bacterium]